MSYNYSNVDLEFTIDTMCKQFIAYTDEAGNTGNNLFDANQPFFWTGTLLTNVEVSQSTKIIVEKWRNRLGFEELHGSELGIHRIEQMSGDLGSLIRTHDLRFVFTRLEKAHLATTKFVDTVFDSGINEAVSPLQSMSRLLHLHMTTVVAELMDLRDRKDFWKAYNEGDCRIFCTVVERLKQAAKEQVTDSRARELLIDALEWAFRYLPRQNSVTDTETIDIADLRRIEILYTVPFCRLWLAGWR